jgi:hypothetical protein
VVQIQELQEQQSSLDVLQTLDVPSPAQPRFVDSHGLESNPRVVAFGGEGASDFCGACRICSMVRIARDI